MNCPRCQYANPPRSNFCLGCGTRLGATCGACGTDLPVESRFCNQCGTPVSGEPAGKARFTSPQSYTSKHLADKICIRGRSHPSTSPGAAWRGRTFREGAFMSPTLAPPIRRPTIRSQEARRPPRAPRGQRFRAGTAGGGRRQERGRGKPRPGRSRPPRAGTATAPPARAGHHPP